LLQESEDPLYYSAGGKCAVVFRAAIQAYTHQKLIGHLYNDFDRLCSYHEGRNCYFERDMVAMRKIPVFCSLLLFLAAACTNPALPPAAATQAEGCQGTIAFVSDKSGHPQIYTMHCDSSDWQQLTTDTHDNYAPSWSPDGTRIAYYKHLSENSWAIFVMDADGGNPTQITPSDGSVLCASAPSWSPDGTRVLFMVESSNRPTCEMKTTDIALIDADGSHYHLLIRTDAIEIARSWSPDGKKISYHATENGGAAIWLMNADGSDPVRLTDASARNLEPAISPDGSRIAFLSDRSSSTQLYVMDLDGSRVTQLTNEKMDYNWPSWSPDGSQILFSAGNFHQASVDVYIINADGSGLRQLTQETGLEYEADWTGP
jgi:Tol biopolymer transport system component